MRRQDKRSGLFTSVIAHIRETIMTKRFGFYVTIVAWLLTLIHTITYSMVPGEIFNIAVIIVGVVGLVLSLLLALSRMTSNLSPIILMISDLLSLTFAAGADGIIDYLSTFFFDGFSLGKIFDLPFAVWFSILSFVLSFIISSVAMYLPQQRREDDLREELLDGLGEATEETTR